MIGVKPEGADGAAVHVIGGAVDTQWLRAFAQAHEKAGFDRVLVGYTSTSAEGFAVTAVDFARPTLQSIPHVRFAQFFRGSDSDARVFEIVRRYEQHAVAGKQFAAALIDSKKLAALGQSLRFRQSLAAR